MLPVVDQLAGFAVRKGGRASAEPGPRFEHEHTRALAGEPDRGAQAGEAGAEDDDVRTRQFHSHCLSAMSACRGLGTRARAVKTSYPLRSIRFSVSKYTARMISAAISRFRSSAGLPSIAF